MPDAVEATVSPRRRARFARHVDECPECGPMLRGLIRVRAALRSIGAPTAGEPSVVPAVLERLRAEEPPASSGRG